MKIMQVSSHSTNEFCGDGTTTSTVIANSIFKEGVKYVESGFNPVLIKRGMEKAKDAIISYLEDTKVMFDYSDKV